MRPSLTIAEATALLTAAEVKSEALVIQSAKLRKVNDLKALMNLSLEIIDLISAMKKLRLALEAETKTKD